MAIVALDPGQASQPDLTGYYELTEAARAADRPDAVQASYEATVERMKAGGTGLSSGQLAGPCSPGLPPAAVDRPGTRGIPGVLRAGSQRHPRCAPGRRHVPAQPA